MIHCKMNLISWFYAINFSLRTPAYSVSITKPHPAENADPTHDSWGTAQSSPLLRNLIFHLKNVLI